jgi:hypothetical protein
VIVTTSAWNICISVENVVGSTRPRKRRNPLGRPCATSRSIPAS